jgi:autotransporter-associated beta strand protein
LLNSASIVFGAQGNHTGAGVLNHNGGNVTFYSDGGATVGGTGRLVMASAANPGGSYSYNFNGGTLTVPHIARENTANNATAVFNFNGGTLKPTASSTTFMQGLSDASVKDGGAVIDSNGFNITVAQPLLAAGTGGLTKNDTGTLTLNSVNTYAGPTVANARKLVLGKSPTTASSIAALNDATIELASDGTHNQFVKTGEIKVTAPLPHAPFSDRPGLPGVRGAETKRCAARARPPGRGRTSKARRYRRHPTTSADCFSRCTPS